MRKRIVLSLMLLPILLFMAACSQNNPIALKYTLQVSVTGQGTVSPNYAQFNQGTVVALEIRPAQGWKFSRWEGNNRYDVSGSQNSWKILMNSHKSLIAVFESEGGGGDPSIKHSLNITALGQGNVSPSSGTFQDGQLVDLTVSPGNGWVFDRWEGPNKNDVSTSNGRYSIRMNSDKNLLAVFAQNQRNLDIIIEGKGKVEEKLLGGEYDAGSIVRLTAIPNSGWSFKEWRGDERGNETVIFVELDTDKRITAVFSQNAQDHDLTIKVVGKGKVEERLISGEYAHDSLVELTAVPNSGWTFRRWTGDASGTARKTQVEMDSDKTITAEFIESSQGDDNYYLDITIEGKGKVTKSPNRDEFKDGEVVTLTAVANSGWVFEKWSGDAKGSNSKIEIEMDSDKYITAIFVSEEEDTYKVDVTIEGRGTVTKSPNRPSYEYGDRVTLTADADSGWTFKEWRGDASGTGSQTSVKVSRDMKVTAVFVQRHTLNVNIQGSGTVTKTPDSRDYEDGARVILTANPASGWKFAGWSGDASGTGNSVTITMDSNKNVTARFEQNPTYTLNIVPSSTAGGTVSNSPNKGAYDQGEVVTVSVRLTNTCWSVTHWVINGQTINSNAISQRVTMTQNTTGTVHLYYDTNGG